MTLVSNDGFAGTQAANDRTTQPTRGAQATVLTVWAPFTDVMARAIGLGPTARYAFTESDALHAANRDAALLPPPTTRSAPQPCRRF
jgi:hypothetical protein